MGSHFVGVDVGGTFTDLVMLDQETGELLLTKTPSTPPEFATGFLTGLGQLAAEAAVDPAAVARLVHGTTVATNAILERKGARLGIVMTGGFEDVLIVGRANRRRMYDLAMAADEPLFLAPRRQIVGVPERVDDRGSVIVPLDEMLLEEKVAELVEVHQVSALVVCFLHSYANPAHELRAREVISTRWPKMPVSLSSEVDPHFREYDRLVVTALDAYVRPAVAGYLNELQDGLHAAGYQAPLQVIQSRGGISGAWRSIERPISTVVSGPAAGVVAASRISSLAGFDDCVTFDVGGTSADVALVKGGTPIVTTSAEVDGYPIRVPMIDIETVGAGGGSIAWVDGGGMLKVGPHSAGASPGPACYGLGGTEPAVTDASVVLGYLDASSFAGGIRPDREAAAEAIERVVAKPLGIGLLDAALGIHQIVNSRMAQTVRLASVGRGEDPRALALVAFGGAGPVHANRLAAELGMRHVIVPPVPGVSSALGLLYAPIEHDKACTFRSAAGTADVKEMKVAFDGIDAVCEDLMSRDGVQRGAVVRHFAGMRYAGQSYELEVPLDNEISGAEVDAAISRFHELHRKVYAYAKDGDEVEFVDLRTVHTFNVGAPRSLEIRSDTPPPPPRERDCCFDSRVGFVKTPVLKRHHLPVGKTIIGPAIIEQADTTTVLYPGDEASVHTSGSLVIKISPAAR
jgi:N-methylhydantoinase A/oxoprolinase/acetone carboxylase beta subunit